MAKTGEKVARRFSRAMRLAARLLLWVVLGIALLVAIGLAALWLLLPDEEIRRLLVAQIEQQTEVQAEIGTLRLRLLEGVVVERLRLGPPQGFKAAPLEIDRLVLEVEPFALLRRRLVARRARVEGLRLALEWRTESGGGLKSNIGVMLGARPAEKPLEAVEKPREAAPEPEAPGLIIDLEDVEVRAVEIALLGHPAIEAAIRDLAIDAHVELGSAEHSQGEVTIRLPLPAEESVRLQGVGTAVGLSLSFALTHGRLSAQGMLSLRPGPVPTPLEVQLEAVLELATGALTVDRLGVRASGEELLSARAEVRDLFGAPRATLDLERAVLVSRATQPFLAVALGPLDLSGFAALSDTRVEAAAKPASLSARGKLELEKLALRAGAVEIAGGSGSLGFELAPSGLGLKGDVRADAVLAGGARLDRTHLSLAGRGRVGSGTPAEVDELAVRARIGHLVRADVSADEVVVEADLQAQDIDPARLGWLGRLAGEVRLRAAKAERGALSLSRPQAKIGLELAALDPQSGLGSVRLQGELFADELRAAGLWFDRPKAKVVAGGRGLKRGGAFLEPLALEGRIEAERLRLQGDGVEANGGRLVLESRARIRSLSAPIDTEVHASLADPAAVFAFDKTPARPGPIDLRIEAEVDLARTVATVRPLGLRLGDLFSFEARGSFAWGERRVALDFGTSWHALDRLVAALPQGLGNRLPRLSGEVRLGGFVRGRLEPIADLQSAPFDAAVTVEHRHVGAALDSIGLAVEGVDGVVQLELFCGAPGCPPAGEAVRSRADLTIARVAVAPVGFSARGLELHQAAALSGEEVQADAWFSAEEVQAEAFGDAPLQGFRIDFSAALLGGKALDLNDLCVRVASLGLELYGHGRFVRGAQDGELMQGLALALEGRARFASPSPVGLPGGVQVRGTAGLEVGLEGAIGDLLHATGRLSFDGFHLKRGPISLEGMRGSIPLQQDLRLWPRPALVGSEAVPTAGQSPAYEKALRPLKGAEETFAISALEFRDLVLSDITGNLELAGGLLGLYGLRFGFLGGDVEADTQLVFAPADRRRLKLDAELSGVDLSKLGAKALAGASEVNGNMHLTLDLAERDATAVVHLTEIGRSTLEALLTAVDPNSENQSVADVKRNLERFSVSPRGVSLNLRHGLLSMRVELDMGLIARLGASFVQGFDKDAIAIPNLPVGGLLVKYLTF